MDRIRFPSSYLAIVSSERMAHSRGTVAASIASAGYWRMSGPSWHAQSYFCEHRGYVLQTGEIVLRGKADELQANEEVRRAYLGG